MIFDWLKRRRFPKKISGIEVKTYEFSTDEAATEFFRLQIENANLAQQLQQCENNFRIVVDLEVNVKTSELAEEVRRLKLENLDLKRQIETLN